jgi:hypothetical protein
MRSSRFLDYWAANMCFTWALTQGAQWPGFRYTEPERATMRALAERASGGRYWLFVGIATVLFIAAAALLVVFAMLPLMTWFWPDAARTPAAGFFGVLAALIALCLGPVFLLVIHASAWLADLVLGRGETAEVPGDHRALLAKVRWQFIRFALVLGGLFVPAALIWSTLNAELRKGILWTLQAVYVLVMAISIFALIAARRARR